MAKRPRKIEQSDTPMQAIWTGLIVAAVVFVASFLYFTGKQTNMTSNPSAVQERGTTGSTPSR